MKNNKEKLIANGIVKRYSLEKGVGPVSFCLEVGKLYSIIGPNASGKTTLIRCLCKLEELDSGDINYNSILNNEKNRLLYSAVFQKAEPWPHLSVLNNIILPLTLSFNLQRNEAQEIAEIEIERFGLKRHYNSFPHQLSGGLKQRVVQARTFAMKPKFLFLDEPTSALDPEWTEYFGSILKEYIENGNMVLVIAHQMNFLKKISDHVFFLENGVLSEEGQPSEIFNNPKNQRLIQFLANS